MTQLNEEHFEVIDRNKDAMLQRNKVTILEDRIATLEKSVERLHKNVGTMDKYKEDNNKADFVKDQGYTLKEKICVIVISVIELKDNQIEDLRHDKWGLKIDLEVAENQIQKLKL